MQLFPMERHMRILPVEYVLKMQRKSVSSYWYVNGVEMLLACYK